MRNFALIGVAGFVAPRHLEAIRASGNRLVAATDPHDSVGVLDRFFPDARYFREIERFDRHIEKLRRGPEGDRVHFVSVCSPNYLHDAHIRLGLRLKADVICEKPLVINPWNLDALSDLEQETGHRVFTVLQLRFHPTLIDVKRSVDGVGSGRKAEVVLSYVTRRGSWYDASWKGAEDKSGGIAMNIGIHFFDLLFWLFGKEEASEVHLRTARRMAGTIELEGARVRWFLSVDERDLPSETRAANKPAFRSLTLDGQEIEFSDGFTDLHTRVYEAAAAGKGFGIKDARPSIEFVHAIREAETTSGKLPKHPRIDAR